MLLRHLLTAAALIAATTVVVAQSNPIETRRNLMKNVGAAAKLGGQMAKAEVPFELAKAQEVLSTFGSAAETAHTHFPEDSKTGGETTAAPAIWESQAEFRSRFENWSKDIKQAAAETKDLPTFRTAFGNVTKACGSCHNTYRIKT